MRRTHATTGVGETSQCPWFSNWGRGPITIFFDHRNRVVNKWFLSNDGVNFDVILRIGAQNVLGGHRFNRSWRAM
jgi:hypothetical protein